MITVPICNAAFLSNLDKKRLPKIVNIKATRLEKIGIKFVTEGDI